MITWDGGRGEVRPAGVDWWAAALRAPGTPVRSRIERQPADHDGIGSLARRPSARRVRQALTRLGSMAVIALTLGLLALPLASPVALAAQAPSRIKDLTAIEGDLPVRLVGYGIVVGLDGTGDRAIGTSQGGGATVRSVANLLRNLGVDVPETMIRTRNAAAVLVTAEATSYLRRGNRFDVSVASLGDATSLRGGQLWVTPLVGELQGQPIATAQGPIVLSQGNIDGARLVETSGMLPQGGVAVVDLAAQGLASVGRLLLRRPDLTTAQRIAETIAASLGEGSARVEDPGSVAVQLPADQDAASVLAAVGDLEVIPDAAAQVVIDARDGTVAVGGPLTVGPGVVSHGYLTITVGATAPDPPAQGVVRMDPGVSVQDVAEALHAVGATPESIAAVFESLHRVGALRAQVVVR